MPFLHAHAESLAGSVAADHSLPKRPSKPQQALSRAKRFVDTEGIREARFGDGLNYQATSEARRWTSCCTTWIAETTMRSQYGRRRPLRKSASQASARRVAVVAIGMSDSGHRRLVGIEGSFPRSTSGIRTRPQ